MPIILYIGLCIGLCGWINCAEPPESGIKRMITSLEPTHQSADMESATCECPNYMRKDTAPLRPQSTLPSGYFLFGGALKRGGLFGSRLSRFVPFLVPGTGGDYPVGVEIGDEGTWAVYFENKCKQIILIRPDGRHRTVVPARLDGLAFDRGERPRVGFLRDGPLNTEIFYLSSAHELRAVRVQFKEDAPPTFGNDRRLALLDNNWAFHPGVVFGPCVVGDRIFGQLVRHDGGIRVDYTGFVTLPNGGTGLASADNIYTYSVPIPTSAAGCAHALSHDGAYAVANANKFGGSCVPKRHNGFYMVPFFTDSHPPVDPYSEMIELYGESINWCPHEYRYGGCGVVDWMGWGFTNDNRYLTGRLGGRDPTNGIWLCEWEPNAWYPLTPRDSHIETCRPAAFIGPIEEILGDIETTSPVKHKSNSFVPIDPCDPGYEIIQPNTRDTLIVGDTLLVKVRSRRAGNATLYLTLQGGRYRYRLPTNGSTINPLIDSVHTFVVPDSVHCYDGSISTVSNYCGVMIQDYADCEFYDHSDESFVIASPSPLQVYGGPRIPY
ncbi:MAG: hypothetical protein GF363_00725 [Chitinivibrionales bacterium]|nr:hypothetical protein [Chitinivibrionales bacterium]